MAENNRGAPARRGLADILDDTPLTPSAPIGAEAVRAVAQSSGLAERSPLVPSAHPVDADVAFIKPKTDRNHTINVRVNREARAYVAREAMARGVSIAQVIEDAITALRVSRERGGESG